MPATRTIHREVDARPSTVDGLSSSHRGQPHHAARMARDVSTVLRVRDANGSFGEEHVRWMVHTGRWQRPVRGVLVKHSGSLTPDERILVELLAQPSSAAVAGLTAATLDGLQGLSTPTIFLILPHTVRVRPRPGVVIKRTRTLTPDDIHPVRAPRRTRLPRSIVDAASWAATDLRCQAIIASAVQQGLVTPAQLADQVERQPKLYRHALMSETIRDVGGGSLSEYEILFLRLCRDFDLPTPTRQRRRRDASGRWRYLDVEFDEYHLVVEIDGQQHMEALAWWEDMARNNEIVVEEGKTLLRFAGFALRHQRDEVARVLLTFFAARRPAG